MRLSLASFFGLLAVAGMMFSYAQVKMPNHVVGRQPVLAYCIIVFLLGVSGTLVFTSLGLSLDRARGAIVCAVLSGLMWVTSLFLISGFDDGVVVANLGIHVGQVFLVVGLTIWLIVSNPLVEETDAVLDPDQVDRLRASKKTAKGKMKSGDESQPPD